MRIVMLGFAALLGTAFAQEPAKKPTWFEKSVSKLEASFEPKEAKPGQTVTFSLTIELNKGYHTYPTVQVDPMAVGMVNSFKFPKPDTVIFVEDVVDPNGFTTHSEPILGIKEIRQYEGKVVFTRKAVIDPAAKAGEVTVTLPAFTLSVCDDKNCFPSKTLMPEAKITILDGPAVPVEAKYQQEVFKATSGM
jgi:hypothetical protein